MILPTNNGNNNDEGGNDAKNDLLLSGLSAPLIPVSDGSGGGNERSALDSLRHEPLLLSNEREASSIAAPHNVPRLFCAILASITTGSTAYAFSIYSAALKHRLHLTESQLDTISSFGFSAGFLSSIPGLFVDKFGTRIGMAVGGTLGSASLLTYWSIAKGHLPIGAQMADPSSDPDSAPNLVIALLSALAFSGFIFSSLVTGSLFKIIVTNCGPGTKGVAVGVAKAYVGLGSGACTVFFEAVRSPVSSDLDFLLLIASMYFLAAAIPGWLMLPNKKEEMRSVELDQSLRLDITVSGLRDVTTPVHFRLLYASILGLVVTIVGDALWTLAARDDGKDNDANQQNFLLGGFVLCVWLGPIIGLLFLPHRQVSLEVLSDGDNDDVGVGSSEALHRYERLQPSDDCYSSEGVSSDNNGAIDEAVYDTIPSHYIPGRNSEEPHIHEPDYTLLEMLATPTAWYLLWTVVILVGSGTVITNNLGQMVESLRFRQSTTPACIALFSVSQSIARVATGTISEIAMKGNAAGTPSIFRTVTGGIPRPVFLIVASLIAAISHGILAVSSEEISFVSGFVLSAFAFGMLWPLIVLIVGEVSGTRHLAANYMFYDGVSLAGGTLLLTKLVAQEVYDRNVDDGAQTCYGKSCFQMTHAITALLSLTCVGTSVMLLRSSRHVYNRRAENVSSGNNV